jgi:hypothetical protein
MLARLTARVGRVIPVLREARVGRVVPVLREARLAREGLPGQVRRLDSADYRRMLRYRKRGRPRSTFELHS